MIKLHFGCGSIILKDWINIDVRPRNNQTQKVDLSKPLPWQRASVDYVYSEAFFEHLTKVSQIRLLKECYRILKPGGVLRIGCPDLYCIVKRYLADKIHLASWAKDQNLKTACAALNWLFYGKDRYKTALGHQYLLDFEELNAELKLAGFKTINRVVWGKSKHKVFQNLETRPAEQIDLIVEAIR